VLIAGLRMTEQPTLWDAILPGEWQVLPLELGRVDGLLDDPAFFAPFARIFDTRIGRPSVPVETYVLEVPLSAGV
jgi:IS5 family transposase